MSKRPDVDFINIMSESGIPTTAAEFEVKLKEQVIGAGSNVSNDSVMSPFWSWVRAAVITPCVWLMNTLLADYVMPNMFVATAQRWALELKAWELNLVVKAAKKTTGYITLTKANESDVVTVAENSVIQTLPIDGVVYQVRVLIETALLAGSATGKVLVEAIEAGAAYNLTAGYFNILPIELPGIVSATNSTDWILTLGANEETDEELALRCQNAFTSSGEWHINDVYRGIISSVGGIRSDNIFFENTGHVIPGSATAYILLDVGETPQSILDDLNHYIMSEGHHGHGDVLTCSAIPEQRYALVATTVFADNTNETRINELKDEINHRIRAAFRETEAFAEITRARPNSRFSLSEMVTEIHNAMPLVKSLKISVDGVVQNDIISGLVQPRLASVVVTYV